MKGTNIRPRHGGDKDNFGRGMPWILCDLAPVGKRLVRGNPEAKNFWTFCPLKKFPRDKVKISECEKCEHFKGYRKSFSNEVVKSLKEFGDLTRAFQRGTGIGGVKGQKQEQPQQSQGTKYRKLNVKKGKSQPKRPRITLTEKDLEKAVAEREKRDKEWEEEEKRTFKKEEGL